MIYYYCVVKGQPASGSSLSAHLLCCFAHSLLKTGAEIQIYEVSIPFPGSRPVETPMTLALLEKIAEDESHAP